MYKHPKDKTLSLEELEEVTRMRQDPVYKCLALLQGFSIPSEIIQDVFGVAASDITDSLKVPEYKELYTKWSIKIKELSGNAVFEYLLPLSVYVQEKVLADESADPKLRLQVSKEIIDRVKGRAAQVLEVKSLNMNVNASTEEYDKFIQATEERIEELERDRKLKLSLKETNAV